MKEMYGYIRVSTVRQGKGVSLAEQKSAIEQYACNNGISISSWFSEKKTAAKVGRPEFKKMLALLKTNKAAGVVFHKIDRSTRNFYDWAEIVSLSEMGIEIHFASDHMDLNNRATQTAADMHAVMATAYIRNLRDESIKGQIGRLKQGIWPYSAPLGYIDTGKGNPKKRDKTKAPLIRQAFKLYATGEYSLVSLTEKLNSLGLRNTVGKRLYKNATNVILRNPFYIGELHVRATGKMYKGKHHPLISKQLYYKVQDVLDGKFHLRKTKHDHTYRRHITCGGCRKSLVGELQKERVYYRCQTKECETKTIREDVFENVWMSILENISIPHELLSAVTRGFDLEMENSSSIRRRNQRSIQLQLDKIEEKYKKLTDAYLEGLLDKEEYLDRKTQYQVKREQLDDLTDKSKNTAFSVDSRKKLELLKSLVITYKLANKQKKRELLKIVTSNRQLFGKNPLFKLKNSYYRLLKEETVLTCALHRDGDRVVCGQCVFERRRNINKNVYARNVAKIILESGVDD